MYVTGRPSGSRSDECTFIVIRKTGIKWPEILVLVVLPRLLLLMQMNLFGIDNIRMWLWQVYGGQNEWLLLAGCVCVCVEEREAEKRWQLDRTNAGFGRGQRDCGRPVYALVRLSVTSDVWVWPGVSHNLILAVDSMYINIAVEYGMVASWHGRRRRTMHARPTAKLHTQIQHSCYTMLTYISFSVLAYIWISHSTLVFRVCVCVDVHALVRSLPLSIYEYISRSANDTLVEFSLLARKKKEELGQMYVRTLHVLTFLPFTFAKFASPENGRTPLRKWQFHFVSCTYLSPRTFEMEGAFGSTAVRAPEPEFISTLQRMKIARKKRKSSDYLT